MEEEYIVVKLTREEADILKEVIQERQAYTVIGRKLSKFKTLWITGVIGSIMTIYAFWDIIKIKV